MNLDQTMLGFVVGTVFVALILPPLAYFVARLATRGMLHEKYNQWATAHKTLKETTHGNRESAEGEGGEGGVGPEARRGTRQRDED